MCPKTRLRKNDLSFDTRVLNCVGNRTNNTIHKDFGRGTIHKNEFKAVAFLQAKVCAEGLYSTLSNLRTNIRRFRTDPTLVTLQRSLFSLFRVDNVV